MPGARGLNRRRFAFFLPLDIAVGIARECNCYSAAALRCSAARHLATDPAGGAPSFWMAVDGMETA
jgi:hypothetical protein